MGKGVYTPNLRLQWAKGQVTDTPDEGFVACGDGTAFPMEVTGDSVAEKLDKIAEIFYRVKDAKFISGSATMAGDESTQTYYTPTTSPVNRSFADNAVSGVVNRGYTTEVEIGPAAISAHNDPYLREEYDRGDSVMCRDIGLNERGIWLQGYSNATLPFWNWNGGTCVNAFSFSSELHSPSDPYSPADTDYFQVGSGDLDSFTNQSVGSVAFNGKIAVVKANPTDSFFAPTNRYFIGLYLAVYGGYYPNDFFISTQKIDWDLDIYPEGKNVICCDYVIKLSGDRELKCPVYGVASSDFPYGLYFSGYDFIHEATDWWPYAKNSPAVPVWNTLTGEKL